FALMSLVPILLTLYLVSQPADALPEPLAGRQGIILGLMIASAISGFLFIKSELGRVFQEAVLRASQSTSDEFKDRIREISTDEISRISGTIEQITSRLETGSDSSGVERKRFRDGVGRLADAIRSARDVERLVELLTDAVREGVAAKTAYFVGVDEENGDFVTTYATGEAADEVKYRRVPLGEGVPGLAARERGPLLLHDLDAKGKAGLGLKTAPISTLAGPIHLGDTLFGVLILHDREDGTRFTEDDMAAVHSMTALAAVSLGQWRRMTELEESFDNLVRAFSRAIEQRDPYARGHADRVALYCEEMARALKLDEETIRNLRRAALLHGVGRITLSDALLRKEERLSGEELERFRSYAAKTEEFLRDVPVLGPVCPMVRHHLEMADGSGPEGLQGDAIPLTTHILIVANAFDAMTSDRSYRQAEPLKDAFKRIKDGLGKQYDARAAKALMSLDPAILKGAAPGTGKGAGAVKGQGAASISVMD
ncbi:MAG TPA: HD domain-containing phosphohydrolase, partial [bacterium]|nr:HD domain-containing phosphohydrolase [bacterium]